MHHNFILLTDTYKACSHHQMMPTLTNKVYSYLESRGGRFNNIVFFGLEYYLQKYFDRPRFTLDDINEAENFLKKHCPTGKFNKEDWVALYNTHGGQLPIQIEALAEGTITKPGIPLLTIFNTDDRFPWLTNRLESILLQLWYPITIATQSFEMLEFLKQYMSISN